MSRTSFESCLLAVLLFTGTVPAIAQVKATPFVTGLNGPVAFVQDPTDPTVQMVVEKRGIIWVVQNGVKQTPAFLDISDPAGIASSGEQGLLGLAFAPDYATSRRFYVSFTNANGPTNASGASVIARFLRDASDPHLADATTRFDLQWPGGLRYIPHPPINGVTYTNHNGGNIAFGPDGYLYIGLGDGGSGNDPEHRAQNPQSLLGKMLRLDVSVSASDPEGYDVPPTNPFVGNAGVLGEIWAFGLRNPWRWSFDWPRAGSTGALVIADVGQGTREEVNFEPLGMGGRNYGWRNREGTVATPGVPGTPPYFTPLVDPIWEYDRNAGRSITGGFVYRGNALGSAYRGRYFVADYATSKVWSLGLSINPGSGLAVVTDVTDHTTELGSAATNISSFGVDAFGELYIVNLGGSVHRIDPLTAPAPGSCAAADPYVSVGGGACIGGAWHSRARGTDLNGDERADVVFQNTSGQLFAWFMNGKAFADGDFFTPGQVDDSNKRIVGMNDFSGDGRPDLLVQHQVSGALSFYLMGGADGLTRTAEVVWPVAVNTPWRVVATGDFDGDTHADVLWTNPSTGQLYLWFMQPASGQPGYGGPSGSFRGGFVVDTNMNAIALGVSAWRIVGAADINGDGTSDIFFQNDSTGDLGVWTMAGAVASLTSVMAPARASTAWKIRAVGDFNLDQHPDLIWQHATNGGLYIWSMVGPRLAVGSSLSPSQVNPVWQVMGPR